MKKTPKQSSEPNLEQIAIDRLRRSWQEFEAELHSNGVEAGRSFVLNDKDADAACQRRLERAERDGTQIYRFAHFAKVLSGEDGTEFDWRQMLEFKHGEDIEEPEWMMAFVEGALEKFRELGEKL